MYSGVPPSQLKLATLASTVTGSVNPCSGVTVIEVISGSSADTSTLKSVLSFSFWFLSVTFTFAV